MKNGSLNQKKTVHRLVFASAPAFDRNEGFSTYELTLPYLISGTLEESKEGVVELPVERVEFHLLRDGLVLASDRGETAFAHLVDEVLTYASKTLAGGKFPPCPGYWCRWCDFKKQCQREGGLG